MTGWEDISCLRDQLKAHPLLGDPNRVLLLTCHGSMATSEQVRLFLFDLKICFTLSLFLRFRISFLHESDVDTSSVRMTLCEYI